MELSNITAEPWEFVIDHSEKQKQGVYLYYKGVPYPRRVYHNKLNDPNHFLRVLNALGTVKKVFLTLTYLKNLVIPRTLNFKKYEAFLIRLYFICDWNLTEFYLKDNEYSVPVWEIGKFVKLFLSNLGFTQETANNYSKVVMMILEYDNAYRYRVQDILGEANKEDLIANPRKEIKRLSEIYFKREGLPGAKEKISKFMSLRHLLLLPKFKIAFKDAAKALNLPQVQLDINDRYHTSFWRGYDYGGQNFDKRYQFFLDTHKNGFPPYKKRQQPDVDFLTGE